MLQLDPDSLQEVLQGAGVVLLQREVPERINLAVAAAAKAAGVIVMLVCEKGDGFDGVWVMQAA